MNAPQLQPEQITDLLKQISTIKAFLLAIVIFLGLFSTQIELKDGTVGQKLISLLSTLVFLLLCISISIFCWTK